MNKFHSMLLLALLICINSFSQNIQWASEVVFQSEDFNTSEYSANAILGRPDAEPYGRVSKNAFRVNTENSTGHVILSFDNPHPVSQVIIVENYLPGQISKVRLHDTNDQAHSIYEAPRRIIDQPYYVTNIEIETTSYNVKWVEIHFNTFVNHGWSQIDAVGICKEYYDGEVINLNPENIAYLTTRERLSDNINTEYDESKPIITPDGQTLFFVRKNTPTNIGKKRDNQDIYKSQMSDGEWDLAQNAGRPLNDRFPNGVCSVSPDGNTLMVINAYNEDGTATDGVSVSRRTKSGWSEPRKQQIEDFHNRCAYQDYFLVNTGKVLISSLQRDDSHGDQDIYVSFKTGEDSWSKPKNLGPIINTSKVEYAPFLAADNKTIYFSSNGHDGHGGSDIFYCRRLDDSWTNWTVPKNIGESVNSPGWDGYYTISAKGDYVYFTSTAEIVSGELVSKNEDIYRISLAHEAKPDPVVLVTGTVVNSKTNEPVEAEISYESFPIKDEEGMAKSDPNSGKYKMVLPTGKKYKIRAFANGYFLYDNYEDFTLIDGYMEISKTLDLLPQKKDTIVELRNILFVLNKDELLPESIPVLTQLLNKLNQYPTLEIELIGHTDNQGNPGSNMVLSEKRALAIVNYLVENGIDKKRLSHVGYGDTRPITDNDTPESRKKNRRVEIKVLKI